MIFTIANALRFGPWIVTALAILAGGVGVKGCVDGLEERGRAANQIANLEADLEAEATCSAGSRCATRTMAEAIAAEREVAARLDEIRANNEKRVADAVARYARSETRTRIDLERLSRELQNERETNSACDAWASQRVGCIVRPIGPREDRLAPDPGRDADDPQS